MSLQMLARRRRAPDAEPGGLGRRNVPRAVRNVLANWGIFVVGTVANLFLAPFVVHSLGQATYGAWVLLGSLVGYLGLLDLGVRGAVMRFVARMHATADHEESGRFASAGLFLFSLSAVVAAAGGLVLSAEFDRVFTIPPELRDEARTALVLCGFAISLTLLNGVYGGIITAMERFDINGIVELSIEALRIAAVVVALSTERGIVALAAIQLSCGCIRLLVSIVISRRLYPELRPSLRGWGRSHLREILGFSLVSTILQGARMIILQLDALVIAYFLPVSMVTFFVIASNLTYNARGVVDGIAHIVTPRVSALAGTGAQHDLRLFPLTSGRVATLVIVPITMTFMLRGETFIGIWMDPEYARPSGEVLWVLSLALWFMAGRQIISVSLMGLNRHSLLVLPFVLEAALNFTLSVLWVRTSGIVGVAWGTTVPSLFFSVLVIPVLFSRELGIPVGRVWLDFWIRPSFAMIPFGLATFAVERYWAVGSLGMFFVQVFLILPVALLGAWRLGLSPEERTTLRGHLPRLPNGSLLLRAVR